MSQFHCFARLPPEIRIRIWESSARPRLVHAVATLDRPQEQVSALRFTTYPPAVMHACRESRRYAPYVRAFITSGSTPRYTWINFEVDMLSLPDDDLTRRELEPHRAQICRLRFRSDGSVESYDSFYYFGVKDLARFSQLHEVHLVVDGDLQVWATAFEDLRWGSCPMNNIRFIDPQSGLMLSGRQLSMACDFGVFHSWDGGGRAANGADGQVEELEDGSHLSLRELAEVD